MANTTSNGVAITAERVGRKGSRSLLDGRIGQQQAHMQGLTTENKAGVTFAEYLARWAASGGPLWAGKQTGSGQCDYFVAAPTTGARRTGIVHKFRHLATEGKRTGCVGGHEGRGFACDATAPNVGDNNTRWRADGSSFGTIANEANGKAVLRAAHAAIDVHVQALYAMQFSQADIAATPSIAQYVEVLGYVVPSKAGKASAPRKARTATIRKPRASKASEPQAEAMPVQASASEPAPDGWQYAETSVE